MFRAFVGTVFGLSLTASANAEMRYDRKIEEAVKTIVAGKIGDIRGSFDVGHDPKFVMLPEQAPTASTMVQTTRSAWSNAPAVVATAPKPKPSSIVAF